MYKDVFEKKNTVLFDMDGTIVDTYPCWRQALEKVLKDINVTWVYVPNFLTNGATLRQVWEKIADNSPEKLPVLIETLIKYSTSEFIKIVQDKNTVLEVKPGFWDLMVELRDKKFKVGLGTNTSKEVTEAVLKKIGADQKIFDVVVTGEAVKRPKPKPDVYVKALKDLKSKPSETVIFEDSIIGATSAVLADALTIVIWNGQTPREYYPPEIFAFVPDFTIVADNINISHKDFLLTLIEQVKQNELQ